MRQGGLFRALLGRRLPAGESPRNQRGKSGTQPTSSFRFIYEAKLELDFVPCLRVLVRCVACAAEGSGDRGGSTRLRGVGVGEKRSLRSTIIRAGRRLHARRLR
jgi:hypothetical protein